MWRNWGVNVLRLLLGAVYVFSGFVKAIDPMGTAYKVGEYMQSAGFVELAQTSFPKWLAVALIAAEFLLGTNLIIGIRRGWTTFWAMVMMVVMTLVSFYTFFFNPVSDCGCFGDAIKLTHTETALKNIPLLIAQLWVWWERKRIVPFVVQRNMPIISLYNFVFIVGFCLLALRYLPLIDFRPYKIGANISAGRTLPEGAKVPVYETTFVYSKDGQQQTFGINNLPDSTWTFVDSKSVLIEEGDKPLMADFNVAQLSDDGGEDVTEVLLSDTSYTFVLIAPYLEQADVAAHDQINTIYDWAVDHKYNFVCLTASGRTAIDTWRDHTGAAYTCYSADEKLLKTIVRSNPGLLLLQKGVILNKWSSNDLPEGDDLTPVLQQLPEKANNTKMLGKILLWYLLLLLVVILLDRIALVATLRQRLSWGRKQPSKQPAVETTTDDKTA